MKEPSYREALAHAWKITKHHKLLWLFGFFATFLGQMGISDLVVHMSLAGKNFAWYPLYLDLKEQGLYVMQAMGQLDFSIADKAWFVWLFLLFAVIGVALIFVSVSSHGALIHGIYQSLAPLKGKQIDISAAWHKGVDHFWRLFALQAIKRLFVSGLTILLGLALFNVISSNVTNWETAIFFALFVLVALVGMVVSLLAVYAAGYVVIEDYDLGEALHEAWYLFKDHWLVSIEIAAIIILLNILVSVFIVSLGVMFIAEMAVLWAIAITLQSGLLWALFLFLGSFLFVLALIFVGTLLSVFTTSVWTYLFVVMHRKGIKSRILHILGK